VGDPEAENAHRPAAAGHGAPGTLTNLTADLQGRSLHAETEDGEEDEVLELAESAVRAQGTPVSTMPTLS